MCHTTAGLMPWRGTRAGHALEGRHYHTHSTQQACSSCHLTGVTVASRSVAGDEVMALAPHHDQSTTDLGPGGGRGYDSLGAAGHPGRASKHTLPFLALRTAIRWDQTFNQTDSSGVRTHALAD